MQGGFGAAVRAVLASGGPLPDRRPVTPIHLAADQNDVFVPALAALLAATVLTALPVIFAPGLRRARTVRPVTIAAGTLAVVALVIAAWQAGVGVRTLQDERARLSAELATEHGYRLDDRQVGSLVDGDPVDVDGSSLRLRQDGDRGVGLLVDGRAAPRTQA